MNTKIMKIKYLTKICWFTVYLILLHVKSADTYIYIPLLLALEAETC